MSGTPSMIESLPTIMAMNAPGCVYQDLRAIAAYVGSNITNSEPEDTLETIGQQVLSNVTRNGQSAKYAQSMYERLRDTYMTACTIKTENILTSRDVVHLILRSRHHRTDYEHTGIADIAVSIIDKIEGEGSGLEASEIDGIPAELRLLLKTTDITADQRLGILSNMASYLRYLEATQQSVPMPSQETVASLRRIAARQRDRASRQAFDRITKFTDRLERIGHTESH